MLGYRFFKPGKFYKVITHRPDTQHSRHFFEVGEAVRCIDVTPKDSSKSVKGIDDFKRGKLLGLFINNKGVEQTLSTGDVKCV